MDLGMNLVAKSHPPLITFSMTSSLNVQSCISSSACFYHSLSLTASTLPSIIKTHDQIPLFSSTSLRLRYQPSISPALSRRLFLPSVSAIWDALTGGNNAREASIAVRRGMQLFRQGDVNGSLVEFDKAIQFDPRQKAYLWQRGLTLYYLDRFEEGAEQFRIDVAMNPNDTEESIWCFLCEAQLYGGYEARRRFLEVGQDSRPVMCEAYNMFKDGGDPEKEVVILSEGVPSTLNHQHRIAALRSYHLRPSNPCSVFPIARNRNQNERKKKVSGCTDRKKKMVVGVQLSEEE